MIDFPALPFPWKVGQHIALIGDTGTGKTTLVQWMLEQRKYALALRAKADEVKWEGYKRVRKILPDMDSPLNKRILLDPRFEDQYAQFAIALDRAFTQGNWTVFVDDLPLIQELDRRHLMLIRRLLIAGRSVGCSTITAMQRPVDVTRYAIGESRLTISFMLERRDVLNIRDSTSDGMAEVVSELGEHDIAIFHRPTRAVWSGSLDLNRRELVGSVVVPPRARERMTSTA